MSVSAELMLLDDLEGGHVRLVDAVRWRFSGDLVHMLSSLRKMVADGHVWVYAGAEVVPDWKLAKWQREPNEPETQTALETTRVGLTAQGIHWLTYGPR